MRKRKQQVTEEDLTLTVSSGFHKRCLTSSSGEYFDRIPADLVIKILSNLSAKSMAKCRCVSKLWFSMIGRQNYNQLFPIKPPQDSPRILFTFVVGTKLYFFSTPQPQNPNNNSSLVPTFHHHTCSRSSTAISQICRPIHGLLCYQRLEDSNHIVAVISNPMTGEYVTTPKVKTDRIEAKTYLGYDPIHKQFKVLCLTLVRGRTNHQVLTLLDSTGNEKHLLWRRIPCCISRYDCLGDYGICINGILYYRSWVSLNNKYMIVCFNVCSEKFDFITERPERFGYLNKRPSNLINYKGKLGQVEYAADDCFVLWVLEDAEEHKWSRQICVTPLIWEPPNLILKVADAGLTCSGEMILSSKYAGEYNLYISYFNLETKSLVRVRVLFPDSQLYKFSRVYTFPNYVEDVKLM